ncbi:MAG: hypothetical protein AABX24_00680 [Nanoarchaeota archaeon]
MGPAGGSGGKKGGHSGFSNMNYQPKKTSNLSSTGYNPKEAHEILDGSLEKRIVAYARIKHGKGEEVAAELSNGNYREVHKDSFDVLERVCNPSEAESIDNVVNHNYQPSALKVALKGTANLINKTCWYYPLVGMLPGKYQEKIAEKLGDNPLHYIYSNSVLEGIVAGVAAAVLVRPYLDLDKTVIGTITVGSLIALSWGASNLMVRCVLAAKGESPVGSPLVCLPYYAALYSIAAVKVISKGVKDSYSSAREQLKEQEAQKRIELETQPNRISIEEAQSTTEAEEGEIEAIQIKTKIVKHKKVPKSIKKGVD